VGAGTVEFLVADGTTEFYFLEMNTRLQVEHPVTELVTGIDLVREQITVAAGAGLSFRQSDIRWRGHAIECRVYAEDPENSFFPSPGKITYLQVPTGPGIRDDSGVRTNSEVSIHYDPLISKLAAWGRTREEAIDRLRRALDEYQVEGIKTNLPFFRAILRDPEFIAGRLDTGFISRFQARLQGSKENVPAAGFAAGSEKQRERDIALIAAAVNYRKLQGETSRNHEPAGESESHWRLAGRAEQLNARSVMDSRTERLRRLKNDEA